MINLKKPQDYKKKAVLGSKKFNFFRFLILPCPAWLALGFLIGNHIKIPGSLGEESGYRGRSVTVSQKLAGGGALLIISIINIVSLKTLIEYVELT